MAIKPKDKTVTVRIDSELIDKIDDAAEKYDLTRSEVIRGNVEDAFSMKQFVRERQEQALRNEYLKYNEANKRQMARMQKIVDDEQTLFALNELKCLDCSHSTLAHKQEKFSGLTDEPSVYAKCRGQVQIEGTNFGKLCPCKSFATEDKKLLEFMENSKAGWKQWAMRI